MPVLSHDAAAAVAATCARNREDLEAVLAPILGSKPTITLQQPCTFRPPPQRMSGTPASPGLAVALRVGENAAVMSLAESEGMLPPWARKPDATGRSKLNTFAQELAEVVLPDGLQADAVSVGWVENLQQLLMNGRPPATAVYLPVELRIDARVHETALVFPLHNVVSVVALDCRNPDAEEPNASAAAPSKDEVAATSEASPPSPRVLKGAPGGAAPLAGQPAESRRVHSVQELPLYTRSLLQLKLPVSVVLAQTRQPIKEIVRLSPGMLIQFKKPCEELIELRVGNEQVALGEAVKVGDKFGIRLSSVVLPGEHFTRVTGLE